MTGYQALGEAAAWLDLTGRAHIRVSGEDRVRWLHAMVSNHIEQLAPGQGCYGFLLNAQGRVLADVNVLRLEEDFLLDLEPETRERILAHLDKHIIADDVTLEDRTDQVAVVGVEGSRAAEVLRALGAPVPASPFEHAAWGQWRVARISATGALGFRLFGPREQAASLTQGIERAGAVRAAPEEARTVRLEHGRPRYGEDITDRHLPQETQLLHALHFNKGCYLGQEIVERIRSRGMVHRFLVPLHIADTDPPAPGTPILAADKQVGEVTSSAYSPVLRRVAALGYVRLAEASRGAVLTVRGAPATLVAERPDLSYTRSSESAS